MLNLLAKILPAANGLVGVAGALALLAWINEHGETAVCFDYSQLAVVAGIAWVMLEINRRTP